MSEESLQTTSPVAAAAAATLPLVAKIGIGLGGFFALLLVLGSIVIHLIRKQDRIKKERLKNAEPTGEFMELHSIIRSRFPREISRPMLGLSIIPSLPADDSMGSIRLDELKTLPDSPENAPPMARVNTKRLSPTKAFSRFSTGIRDSWPLASAGQIPGARHPFGRLQSQPTITVNQVAPPGYMIPPDPEYPSRAYSRSSKTKVSKDPYQTRDRPRHIERRCTAENQLTTILRSTSERLRPSHSRKKSLSRTLTSFSRPGPPPPECLSSPRRRMNDSREVLLKNRSTPPPHNNSTTSLGESSVYEEELMRTPSPKKQVAREAGQSLQKKSFPELATPSEDSLFGADNPELAIPSALSSPSKQEILWDLKNAARASSNTSNSTSSLIQKGSRASVLAFGHPAMRHSASPQPIPMVNDPFYSEVPIKTYTNLGDPRPLYIRKAKQQKSMSFNSSTKSISPLKDISGNNQTPPRRETHSSPIVMADNPFSWSPQAMQSGSGCSSPARLGKVHKKGHKRSQTVRMSVQPARPSSVTMVPEEPEEEPSPFKFCVPSPGIRMIQRSQSPSPSPNLHNRRMHNRPPSSLVFQPHIFIPPKGTRMGRTTISPTKDLQIYSPTLPTPKFPSPTLQPTNYYSEPPTSEDNLFFKARNSPATHRRRECSISPIIPPTALLEEMMAFPSPPSKTDLAPALSPNSEILRTIKGRNISPNTEILQAIGRRTTSPPVPSNDTCPYPTGPSLPNISPPVPLDLPKMPIPGHLTGPRDFPTPHPSPTQPNIFSLRRRRASTVRLPARDSLQFSISLLRRMNSDVSRRDSSTSMNSNSPAPTTKSPTPSPAVQRGMKLRGSSNYHSIGLSTHPAAAATARYSKDGRTSPTHATRVEKLSNSAQRKRDSARLLREKRRKAAECEQALKQAEPETDEKEEEVIVDAIPVDSPASVVSAFGLRFPILFNYSIPKPVEYAEEQSPVKKQAVRKPSMEKVESIRSSIAELDEGKENEKVGLGSSKGTDKKKERLRRQRGSLWDWHGNEGRPESLGLYDSDGFLRSSPVR